MRLSLIALALLAILPGAALAGGDHGFQIEVDALGSQPMGTYEFGGSAADLFDFGGNVFGRALMGLDRSHYLGVGVGYLSNRKEFSRSSLIDLRPPRSLSGTRTLDAIPVLGLVQLRSDTHRTLSWFGEGGLGMTTFERRISNLSNGAEPVSKFQQAFSFMLGAGACLGAGSSWNVLLGASWLQSFTGDGDAFQSGDNPAYVLYSLGVRYPRW